MPEITLRPARPDDAPFLYEVYASTRQEELAPVPWTDEQKAAFLRMQFEAQDRHYRQHYPDAQFLVIQCDERPIGRLYLHSRPAEIGIVDIALLPAYRRAGIGGGLLRQILAEADRNQSRVAIYVERQNPALRLYERLGFRVIGDTGVYYHLARPPLAPPSTPVDSPEAAGGV